MARPHAPRLVLLGLLALLLGRQLPELDAARLGLLVANAAADDRVTPALVAWRQDAPARALAYRAVLGLGHALLLAGLVLAALRAPSRHDAPAARWIWVALLAWTLLLLFAPHPTLHARLR